MQPLNLSVYETQSVYCAQLCWLSHWVHKLFNWSCHRYSSIKPTTHPLFFIACVCQCVWLLLASCELHVPEEGGCCFGACSCSGQLVVCPSGRSRVPTAWQLDLRLCFLDPFQHSFFKKMHIDIFGGSNRCACELNWSSQKSKNTYNVVSV
jgi:hypothetical protein